MLETLVTVIHVLVAVFMILVVLLQGGNQGGVGAAFGGGNSQGVFGATGATSFFGKLTYGAAVVFMLTSITLTIQQGGRGNIGLKEKLEGSSQPAQPNKAEVPAATSPDNKTGGSPPSEAKPDDQGTRSP